MAIIKCKMCGGDIELTADKTFGTCEYCGSTMTLPKVSDEQRAAAFNRGNHFRRIGEFDKALAVYERIVQEDDTDAEAHWCCALCRFGIEYVEDPTTYEWLPTCHRASFDNFLEDVDYLAAVEHSDGITRRQYQKDAAKIAEVQRGILATSQNEEPFDVFICYKESDENGERTRDSILAQDIYYRLTEQGRRVFFARITLEDKAGTEYEPYIFAALHSAKVMIAVGTKPEYFNAVWVKNEWSRFLSLMKKDRSKLLLPCYRDMDPYDLPEQLSVLQSYDMGKIGFLQDLIHGVNKVLDADKKPVKQTVVVQQNAGGANAVALLKRGNMALEDGDWEKADGFFEEVLNLDAECAEAYAGKFLAGNRQKSLEDYVRQQLNETSEAASERLEAQKPDDTRKNTAVQRYTVPGYLEAEKIKALYGFDLTYVSCLAARKAQSEEGKRAFDADKLLSRAFRFAKGAYKETLEKTRKAYFDALDTRMTEAKRADETIVAKVKESYAEHLKQADEKATQLYQEAAARREQDYKAACGMQNNAKTEKDFCNAAEHFTEIGDYADCHARAERCRNEAERLKFEETVKAAAARIEQDYQAACKAQENAKTPSSFDYAASLFEKIGDYADCRARAEHCRKEEERLNTEKKEKEVAAQRKRRNIRIAVALVIVVAIATTLWLKQVILPSRDYSKAEALLAAGDYDAAAEAFAALGDYSDAAERAQATHYAKAEALLEAGDFDAAADAFAALGDYKDAAAKSKECATLNEQEELEAAYQEAVTLMESGETGRAAIAFGKLGDYRDAKECSFELWNTVAVRDTFSAGYSHTVGLKSDGTVVAVGRNDHGQCDVTGWTDIVAVSAGGGHTVGLKADGTVVAVGYNGDGRCDVSGWTNIVAVSARGGHTIGLKADGTVVAVGYNDDGQCDVSGWTDIVAVSAGGWHTVGLKSYGTVVAVGSSVYGLCDVSGWADIFAVSAGFDYRVGLRSNGTVTIVGNNANGLLHVNDWMDIVAVSAGEDHTVGLRSDGTVVAVGENGDRQCDVSGWTNIVAVSAGECHTVGLKSDGTVVAVGNNDYGQCDVTGWTDIKIPTQP